MIWVFYTGLHHRFLNVYVNEVKINGYKIWKHVIGNPWQHNTLFSKPIRALCLQLHIQLKFHTCCVALGLPTYTYTYTYTGGSMTRQGQEYVKAHINNIFKVHKLTTHFTILSNNYGSLRSQIIDECCYSSLSVHLAILWRCMQCWD
jgi:hypothetical protein